MRAYHTAQLTPRPRLLVALVAVLLLAWGLRIHEVETRSLWADEGWTLVLSEGPGLDDVVRTLADDQHPPLYFVAFRLWRSVAGETELALRAFSVLISVVGVAAIYQLGRSLFHPLAGLLAALLLALVDNHIDLAQEVRHYSLLATLAIVSSLFYIRWWRRPTRASRIGYVLASLALLYSHYLGAFVLLAQAAHLTVMALITHGGRRWREGFLLVVAVGIGFLPWLPVVIAQNQVRWDDPLYYRNSVPNSLETYRAVRTALLGSHYGLMAGLLLLGLTHVSYAWVAGQVRARVRLRPLWPLVYPALWIGLMIGLTIYINARSQFLTERNFIVITPALMLLIGHGLANLERTARLLLVGVVLIVGLTTVDARRDYPDWRAVAQNVTRYHLPDEPVLMDVWVGDFALRYYVERQMGAETPWVSLREWRADYGDAFLPRLLDYLREQDAFWLAYWGDDPMNEYGSLIAEAGFQQTAALAVEHQGTPLYSYRYDRLPGRDLAQFGDLFALRQSSVPESVRAGEPLNVALWWAAQGPIPLDYSVSVVLIAPDGTQIAQHDAPPLDGRSQTSTWQPEDVHFDLHTLRVPPGAPGGAYTVNVRVYWYGDRVPLPVTRDGEPGGDTLMLGPVEVRASQ